MNQDSKNTSNNHQKNQKKIFHTLSDTRWRNFKKIGMALTFFFTCVCTVFFISLLFIPTIKKPIMIEHSFVQKMLMTPHSLHRNKQKEDFLLKKIKKELMKAQTNERNLRKKNILITQKSKRIVAAFYTIWQETGIHSFKAIAPQLTHIIPEWTHLAPDGSSIDLYDWNLNVVYHNKEVEKIARKNGVQIMPILNNAYQHAFDPKRVHLLLTDKVKQKKVIDKLVDWLEKNKYQGINVDFENLEDNDRPRYVNFIRNLHKKLHEKGFELSVDLQIESDISLWDEIAKECDFVVVMGYDEHYLHGDPGPVSSIGWFMDVITRAMKKIPRDKLVIGVGNYGYDWEEGNKEATAVTFQEALLLARDTIDKDEDLSKVIDFDPVALNPTFTYMDEFNKQHEVWMLDAVTAMNQEQLIESNGLRGTVVWLLGSEDPSIWTFIDKNKKVNSFDFTKIQNMDFPYSVEFVGDGGDVLTIKSMPQTGIRSIELDTKINIITDEVYKQIPSKFVFQRNGLCDKKVVLTFDDGPYEPYSSQILDELKRLKVPATFFIIGKQAEKYPSVVERMWNEGHEVGNHTYTHPDLSEISALRTRLELNATERIIESILGRSTVLFRPPYNADAEPSTQQEVVPVVAASKLGYIVIGEYIDPQDWNIKGKHKVTAKGISDFSVKMIAEGKGNTILLHDGGGNRKQTVESLKYMVPELQNLGYSFVLVSDLMNTTRDKIMPKVVNKDSMLIQNDRVVFEGYYFFQLFLQIAFIAAIVLGILRVIIISIIACIARRKEKKKLFDENYAPSVSVVIAAYNEAKVIKKTIDAVLQNNYPNIEIIVVDDGSVDNTFEVVAENFGSNKYPAIKCIKQENHGKAIALNHGIEYATGEILVCLDADTIFNNDTIHLLVRHFKDPKIGAVAGNVTVGNRINIITYWQSIEYITSQNLDRRAYASLNAVTVVPGAVGAWRRSVVEAAGGYSNDTFAEDMDLTWRIRKMGYIIDTDSVAKGWTETPDTIRTLFKQRFRWTFGTLQCLWKHRNMLGKYGWFGRLMLPSLWLFQILFQILSPLIDFQIFWTLINILNEWIMNAAIRHEWQPLPQMMERLAYLGFMYSIFFVVDLVGSYIACKMEGEKKSILWWLFLQRFVYRQLMYAVVLKSLFIAIKGIHLSWGKLERKGSVNVEHHK